MAEFSYNLSINSSSNLDDGPIMRVKREFLRSLDRLESTMNDTQQQILLFGRSNSSSNSGPDGSSNVDFNWKSESLSGEINNVAVHSKAKSTFSLVQWFSTSSVMTSNQQLVAVSSVSTPQYDISMSLSSDSNYTKNLYLTIGFSLVCLTLLANVSLLCLAIHKCLRGHKDIIHGLSIHLACVGALQAFYVISGNTLLQSGFPDMRKTLWISHCKAFLFAKFFIPGLHLHLLVSITIAYHAMRFPIRRWRSSVSKSGEILLHGMPWLLSSCVLIPVIIQQRETITQTLRNQRQCLLLGNWSWFFPLLLLGDLPLLFLLVSSICMAIFGKYSNRRQHHDLVAQEDDDHNYYEAGHVRYLRQFKTCRLLMIATNSLALLTQAPFAVINVFQTLVSYQSSYENSFNRPIYHELLEILHWLHLSFYAICAVFISALLVQLERVFCQIEEQLQVINHPNHALTFSETEDNIVRRDKIFTDCMLTSL